MADERQKDSTPLGRVVGKAVTNWLNLSVVGSAAVGAAALHSWPVAALGGVAYAAMVAWDVASPSFWKKALAKESLKMPDPDKLKDHAARSAIQGMKSARAELDKVLEETPMEVKGHLGGAIASMTELEERTIRLAIRAEELSSYLSTKDPKPLRAEIDRLRELSQRARDKEARAQYESARAAREEHLKALEDIVDARERIAANLSRIVATLDGMPAKIVRMRALDAQAMDALSGDMNAELEGINGELRSFEETLKSIAEIAQT